MSKTITIEDKKIKTPKFRVSFPNLDKPKAFGTGEPKYSLTMLFPKTLNLSAPVKTAEGKVVSKSVMDALKAAAVEKWGANADAMIAKLKKSPKGWPIRDGDTEKADMMGYPGHFFVAASAKADNQPGMVDRDRSAIDPRQIYAGCYARAELIAYAYDNQFGKGLGFSLQNVQKLGDGAKFSGKKNAEEVFDAVEDESDDPENYGSDTESTEDSDDLGF